LSLKVAPPPDDAGESAPPDEEHPESKTAAIKIMQAAATALCENKKDIFSPPSQFNLA
jgi:hypothetical protein